MNSTTSPISPPSISASEATHETTPQLAVTISVPTHLLGHVTIRITARPDRGEGLESRDTEREVSCNDNNVFRATSESTTSSTRPSSGPTHYTGSHTRHASHTRRTSQAPPRPTSSPEVNTTAYPTVSQLATDLHLGRPTHPITDKHGPSTNNFSERTSLGAASDTHSTSESITSGSTAGCAPVGRATKEQLDREFERLRKVQAHAIRKSKRKYQAVEFDSDIEDPGSTQSIGCSDVKRLRSTK